LLGIGHFDGDHLRWIGDTIETAKKRDEMF